MAKWGEGDPRWIVEERPDATNVNNWHWTEKDATNWSKDKFRELLVGMVIEDDEGFCEIKELSSMEGEASANNRKSKLIFFYEWNIKGTWSGRLKQSDKKHKGKFEIPNLSEEHTADEIDVNVTADKESDESYQLKEFMRKKGTGEIRQKLAQYIINLKEEYSQGIILPTKDGENIKPKMSNPNINETKEEMNNLIINTKNIKKVGVKIHTKTLKVKEEFKCQASDLYRAFTVKEMVQAYGGRVEMEVEKGGRFTLMGGNITGEFVELVPDKKIIQKWRLKSWPDAHFSEVTLEMEEKEDCTVLSLTQKGIPESNFDETQMGWKQNYWERMKQVFGFGAKLF